MSEPLMYRVHLFEELRAAVGTLKGRRVLEIGPKDGLDSRRLAALGPDELVMIDLPEKPADWVKEIACPTQYVVANLMYLPTWWDLGRFGVVWCTGVLYHNPEQLRLLRRLYRLLEVGGVLVLESATWRGPRWLRKRPYVQVHYPETYRETGTITHLPTAAAINAWLQMVGFTRVQNSRCYERDNRDLIGQRYACLAFKTGVDDGGTYYSETGLNPEYRYGDSV